MLLKDPLVHFLLVGAALFAFLLWRGGADRSADAIVIPAAEVAQLARAQTVLQGRPPTRGELEALVEPAVREEVYYREALALGLDRDDDEVRRRLVEKIRYLSEDLADPEPASADELRAFYERSPERFEIPELVTFDQVYFDPDQRGDALAGDVAAGLAALRGGADPAEVGDRTPLQARFVDAARERVAVLFGESMTAAVFELDPGGWTGPYESDFGRHLVRVVAHTAARLPPFEDVRETVAKAFAEDRRNAANEAAYAEMRSHYDVRIEWPDLGAAGGGEP